MNLYDFIEIFDDLKTERLEAILDKVKKYVDRLADEDEYYSELRENFNELLEESKETGRFIFDDFIPFLEELSDLEANDAFGTEGMRLG
ncbi:hypothetical protein phiOC_p309 [Ochrobactrum phage vB_OspM_OC]|nr:hypothetical protein phiOC_p309 [Ochrobactrum phage vB_OspM_OC]